MVILQVLFFIIAFVLTLFALRDLCIAVFTMITFAGLFIYCVVVSALSDHTAIALIISPLVCIALLIVSWFFSERVYTLLKKRRPHSDNDSLNERKDKNICNLISMLGLILCGIYGALSPLSSGEGINVIYLFLITTGVSIFLGAYVSVSKIYEGAPFRDVLSETANNFLKETTINDGKAHVSDPTGPRRHFDRHIAFKSLISILPFLLLYVIICQGMCPYGLYGGILCGILCGILPPLVTDIKECKHNVQPDSAEPKKSTEPKESPKPEESAEPEESAVGITS